MLGQAHLFFEFAILKQLLKRPVLNYWCWEYLFSLTLRNNLCLIHLKNGLILLFIINLAAITVWLTHPVEFLGISCLLSLHLRSELPLAELK